MMLVLGSHYNIVTNQIPNMQNNWNYVTVSVTNGGLLQSMSTECCNPTPLTRVTHLVWARSVFHPEVYIFKMLVMTS